MPAGFFRLQAAVKLAGKAPDWDYLSYDAVRSHLFIARRDAGLWVFDTRKQRLLRRMPKTEGAGASLLIPALGRGYATNEDGSVTVFNLATLVPIRRVKFAEDADAASYDPASGRIAFVSADSRRVTFMDARSLAVVGHVALEAKKADASVADGAGAILLNERDRNMVARIDAASARITAEWPTTGCTQPTGLAYDSANHRAFIGCRGAKPVLAVMNTDNGDIVATLDLGRGNDGVAFDRKHHRIITTNGVEGNIAIFHQDDANHYRLEQAITTRPNARTLAYDEVGMRIFTVTAEGVVNPAQPINAGPSAFYPNAYYDNSFVVLTYAMTK
ncbi:hypothetical protein [Novosphingobium sp.]|uniref:YncE family protein n=1 Tax=Novosphingobium sp. TaxID=1874826 RepID=UPI0025D13836|nr:hypothetical protein [Novosphingobium sp.]